MASSSISLKLCIAAKKFPTAIFFSEGIFSLAVMSHGTKANKGRKGGERNEDHENSFVSFIFSRSYGFEHSVSGGAEGVISKDAFAEGSYCHMQFPAIEERTLSWKRPVLKDPSEGDIIDFYGPCDHDPLGKEEIQSQKRDLQCRFEREYGS